MQVAYERAPEGFKDIHDVIPKEELEGIGSRYKTLVGMEMGKVNERARETEGTSERLGLKSPMKWVYTSSGLEGRLHR